MQNKKLSLQYLRNFRDYLLREEKSTATVEKYFRDVCSFLDYVGEKIVTKEITIAYKKHLEEKQYAVRSINSMLTSVNQLMDYLGWCDCKVKCMRLQRETYCSEEKELTKEEYKRLLKAASGNEQLYMVLQTICSTGIRVSELKFFTVEAIRHGEVIVHCKSKTRTVLLPQSLIKELTRYIRKRGIKEGTIFVTRKGNPLDRSNIWADMKKLCCSANVNPSKVFPHNLRKLFARTFYGIEKDIAKLADILGHGNIETTRIYIMTTGLEHRQKIECLGLVFHENT